MVRFLLVLCLTLLSTRGFPQQTVTSKGNDNINANLNGQVNIIVAPRIKTELQSAARATFADRNLWEGILVPATDNLPDTCSKTVDPQADPLVPRAKAIIDVVAGGNEFVCTHLPCNIVRTDAVQLLAIDGKPGSLMVEAKVLDENGDIIASIERGRFYVNPNRTYRRPVRKDQSSLKVFDMKGNTVLEMHYANQHTLVVKGIFHAATNQILDIEPDRMVLISPRGKEKDSAEFTGFCDVEYSDAGNAGYASGQFGGFFLGGSPTSSTTSSTSAR